MKIVKVLMGLVVGVFTIPVALIVWPFVMAYILYAAADEED